MLAYIRGLNVVAVFPLENYILKVYPQIYKQVKRQKPGQSEALVGSDVYYRRNEWDERKRKVSNDELTSLLNEDDEATSLLNADEDEATSLLMADDDDSTPLLNDDDEATSLLGDNSSFQRFPYLIRKNTFDRIDINKPVFRIGKEKSYVDYFIGDNNTISRLHADIISRDNRYYLKDNNSTNHSYINGSMVQGNQEAELFDGAVVTLSNEDFEFHI